jgi:hypothetical protein
MAEESEPTTVKVTCKQTVGFYVRACRSFLEGVPAKEATDKKEAVEARPAVDTICVSSLGNAIAVQGAVVGRLQALGVAEIVSMCTDYPKIPNGKITSQVAQMKVVLKAVPDDLPPVSEEGYHEKKVKVVKKEGGKKGAEIAGAADMGGIEYFTTTCETPDGDTKLLEIVVQEMNGDVDPQAEETKGGSKHVAKCVLSASDKQLAICCYVPKSKTDKLLAAAWLDAIFQSFGGYGEVVGESEPRKAVGICKADSEKGRFPVKMRDEAIGASIAFLRSKKLFPEDTGDDDSDEMIFGDDYFPS